MTAAHFCAGEQVSVQGKRKPQGNRIVAQKTVQSKRICLRKVVDENMKEDNEADVSYSIRYKFEAAYP